MARLVEFDVLIASPWCTSINIVGNDTPMSSQGSGPRKRKRQVLPKLVDPSVLKQGQEQYGKAASTVKNYTAMLPQADEWLPAGPR